MRQVMLFKKIKSTDSMKKSKRETQTSHNTNPTISSTNLQSNLQYGAAILSIRHVKADGRKNGLLKAPTHV